MAIGLRLKIRAFYRRQRPIFPVVDVGISTLGMLPIPACSSSRDRCLFNLGKKNLLTARNHSVKFFVELHRFARVS